MCQEIIVKTTQIHNDCKVNDSLQAGQYLICTVVSSVPVNMINKPDRSFQATISEWRTVKVETNKRHKYMELKTLRIHESNRKCTIAVYLEMNTNKLCITAFGT